jgi:hypothetical protein
VEVTSDAPLVDTTTSRVSATVDKATLDALPKGRSFQSVIPFAPGARFEPLQSGTATSGSGVGGFQIDGASDSENVYMVDGVNITNIQSGGVGKNFQMEFIQEVQVKSSGFEAEHGGALGGVINVVPARGSNDWHGDLVAYLRSNAFNANNRDRVLRTNPNLPSTNTTTRLDAVPEYYMENKDQQTIIEPASKSADRSRRIGSGFWPAIFRAPTPRGASPTSPAPILDSARSARPAPTITLHPPGLRRTQLAARLRVMELCLLAADRIPGLTGQPGRNDQHRPNHRSQHTARG